MAISIDLSGHTALVTGSSRGIGRVIARTLAEAGAAVVINYRKSAPLAETLAEEITAAGGKVVIAGGDISDSAAARAVVDRAVHAFGEIDILVNNAGKWTGAAIEEMSDAMIAESVATNLASALYVTREVVPMMKRKGWGRIVNLSSTASLMGEPLHANYSATKAGLDGVTRALAVELGPFGITVNSVAPGWTLTEMSATRLQGDFLAKLKGEIPLRKVAKPEDVAWIVLALVDPRANHVTGATIPIEGGYRLRR
jgi:3-oxoacyl-[acyl-carrier protein] reductase